MSRKRIRRSFLSWTAIRSQIIIAAVSIAASQASPAQAAPISNGSFEEPPSGYQILPGGSTAITGWLTVADGVERFPPLPDGYGEACDGSLIIDLNPDRFPGVGGGIQQDVPTLAGQTYELSFCFSTVELSGRDGTARIDVRADAAHGVFTVSNHTPTIVWEQRVFRFVATDATTTILFSYTGPRNDHFAFIDGVAMVPVAESGPCDPQTTACDAPTFAPAQNYPSGGSVPAFVVAGELDGDGQLDLAVTNIGSANVTLLRGNGDGTFQGATTVGIGFGGNLSAGYIDGDASLDLSAPSTAGPAVSVLLNDGAGGFTPYGPFAVTGPVYAVTVDDVNGDDNRDLVTANYDTDIVSVLLGNGTGTTFDPPVNLAVGNSPLHVTVANLNGDDLVDLAVANADSSSVSILLGNGTAGLFDPAVSYGVGFDPRATADGDFDCDGDLDLVVANGRSNYAAVLLGNGDGTFQSAVNYPVGLSPTAVEVADTNGDATLDFVTADPDSSRVSVLLGIGDGTFQPAVAFNTGGLPFDLALGDFDGDGIDVATANRSSNNVSVLLNTCPACDDGLFCNGVETLDTAGECVPGTPPGCADSIACTVDSCNEQTDSCDHVPDHAACEDGSPCTADSCDPSSGCVNPPGPDGDGDGVADACDNCPSVANADQSNVDGDAYGDACDPCPLDPEDDGDGDGVCCNLDNCCGEANTDQANADGDPYGDVCDPCPLDPANDSDGDGVCCNVDNCCTVSNPDQADSNGNGIGDACDQVCPDSDGDGIDDCQDKCDDSILDPTVIVPPVPPPPPPPGSSHPVIPCNSGVPNYLLSDGCTISDKIAACDASTATKNQFEKCVKKLLNQLRRKHVITERERRKIDRCVKKYKKRDTRHHGHDDHHGQGGRRDH